MQANRNLVEDAEAVFDSAVAVHCSGIDDHEYSTQLLSRDEVIAAREDLESAMSHLADALMVIPDVSGIEPSEHRMTLDQWREKVRRVDMDGEALVTALIDQRAAMAKLADRIEATPVDLLDATSIESTLASLQEHVDRIKLHIGKREDSRIPPPPWAIEPKKEPNYFAMERPQRKQTVKPF